MNFLENIIINKITHVSVINYKKHDKSMMNMRPWYGIAFSLGGELTYTHNFKKIPLFNNQVVFLPKDATYEVACTKPGSFAVINFMTAKKLDITDFFSMELRNIDALQKEFANMYKLFQSDSIQKNCENFSSLYKIFSMLINSSI